MSKQRYWDLPSEVDESVNDDEAAEKALGLMDQAVKRQLVSDVPIGVLLSGGMDSSTIVALMSRHVSELIHTYSVGFEESSFNELPYARIVSKEFNTVQREVLVTADTVRQLLPKYLTYIDEPYADGSAIPTYCVCQLAKGEVVVVLSGEGGDEAFAGYETYSAYKVSRWYRMVPRWIRQSLVAPFVRRLPTSDKKLSLEFKMKRFIGGQELSPAEAHLWWRIVLTETQKFQLYSPYVREQLIPDRPERHFVEAFGRSGSSDALAKLMYVDNSVFLPDDLMVKNDRMSMAHSLEARVPMTDPDLAEYLARLPMRLKLPRLRKKHLMRKAMNGLLPKAILDKKKVGLEMPYSKWFKHELKDLMLDCLGQERITATGLFDPKSVRALVDEHLDGRADHGRALWGLLNYVHWHELYVN